MDQQNDMEGKQYYNILCDWGTPCGGHVLVLWSPKPSPLAVTSNKPNALKASATYANDRRAKGWVYKWTQHAPGQQSSFQDVYRAYCLNMFFRGCDVVNELRFSRIVVDAYKEKGVMVERRRLENRIHFIDLSLLRESSSKVLIYKPNTLLLDDVKSEAIQRPPTAQ